MAGRVMVVEDDRIIQRFLQFNLKAQGYEVVVAEDGEQALEIARSRPVDLVLLDIVLPLMDGAEFCKRLREWSMVPIIVLSAKSNQSDIVAMLDLGADDYLPKPFSVDELLARMRAALRRASFSGTGNSGTITVGDLKIDLARHQVIVRGRDVRLTPTEFRLLHYLASHSGKAITYAELLRSVWGPEYGDEREYLRVFVRQLRSKVEPDPSRPQYLITVPFVGYRLQEPEQRS